MPYFHFIIFDDEVKANLGLILKRSYPGNAVMDMSFNEWIDKEKQRRMIRGEVKHGTDLELRPTPGTSSKKGLKELIDFLNYTEFAML